MSTLVETTWTPDRVTISFPTEDIRSDEIENIISLIKVALIARNSKMTQEQAEEIAEEIKASWWEKNRARILNMIGENG